jgi:hypothetical protein
MSDKPAEKSTGQPQQQDKGKKGERSVEQRLADLELANAQLRAGLPGGTIPLHGAGPYDEIRETWSQADQDAAQAGEYDEGSPEHPVGNP